MSSTASGAPPTTAATAAAPSAPSPVLAAPASAVSQHRAVARAIRNQAWGKDLPSPMVQAIVLWCERWGIEPTEVTVLGGNLYVQASFYLRMLARMVDAQLVEWIRVDHVHADPRLQALRSQPDAQDGRRAEADDEWYRRAFLRAKYNLREDAPGACIVSVKLRSMEEPVVGAKAVGYQANDPVGKLFPAETAETRATRRALRAVVDLFPPLAPHFAGLEAEAATLSARLAATKAATNRDQEEHLPEPGVPPLASNVYP